MPRKPNTGLDSKTVAQLREMATKARIEGRNRMRKAELIAALSSGRARPTKKQNLDVLNMSAKELAELVVQNGIKVDPKARKIQLIRAIHKWAVTETSKAPASTPKAVPFRMPVMARADMRETRDRLWSSAFENQSKRSLAITPLYGDVETLALLALLSAGEPQTVAERLSARERFQLLKSKYDALPMFYDAVDVARKGAVPDHVSITPIPNEWTDDAMGDLLAWDKRVFLLLRRGGYWTMALAAKDSDPFFRASPPYTKGRPYVQPVQRYLQFCQAMADKLLRKENERVLGALEASLIPVWKQQAPAMPPAMKKVISEYLEPGAHLEINQELRDGVNNERMTALKAFFGPDSAFLARLPAGQQLQLYRTLQYSEDDTPEAVEYVNRMSRLQPGDKIKEANVFSTSRDPTFPCHYSLSEEGVRIVYLVVRVARPGSRFFIVSKSVIEPTLYAIEGEGEVILPPGSTFRVTKRLDYTFVADPKKKDKNKPVTVIYMDEIEQ